MTAWEVFAMTLLSSALGFGGFGSLPVLRERLVESGIMGVDALLLQALTVGRLSPGPNGLFLVTVGYLVAGLAGAAAAAAAVLIPPFAILPIAWGRRTLEHRSWFQGALRALSLAVIGLLGATAISLVLQVTDSAPSAAVVACAVVGLLLRVPALVLIGLAAAAGATPLWF